MTGVTFDRETKPASRARSSARRLRVAQARAHFRSDAGAFKFPPASVLPAVRASTLLLEIRASASAPAASAQ